ncbi:uncharacterized protein EV154DRAFT_515765 [Mucor mucedo]|uniref:uncharacterized protein n=1 Tax=Mucor mucedo TaxID=29922 RepID=UPI00221F72C2|nr:uncharacterized protein EV154DRAFT_515765 [Mucor mucedo]KAI7889090.1 hypothetical protein EV154DRAFT_515765 [Mucor mucedo]
MSTNNNNTNSSNATSVFIDHVKQVLTTLPPLTKFALVVPTALYLVDLFVSSFFSFLYWTYLDAHLVIDRWQIQRLVLYPISSKSLLEMIITTFWLLPEIFKAEKKLGTLRLGWVLLTLFTIVPALVYIAIIQVLTTYTPQSEFNGTAGYFGMAGWVVGLVVVNYLKEEGESDRMIAGSIRIPNKAWPVIVLIFFVFLAPGLSFILNFTSALIAFVFVDEKYSKYVVPSDETMTRYEGKAWLSFLTRSPNFVSVDSSGVYLPIFSAPSVVNTPSPNQRSSSASPSFPGTGVRLGS